MEKLNYTTFDKQILRYAIEVGAPFQLIDIFQSFLFSPSEKEVNAEHINERLQYLAENGVFSTHEKEDGDYYVIKAAHAARLRKSGILK